MAASSPSAKAMAWVKNRNNISDMYLRKKLEVFERERDINMTIIDQDKLDVMDTLKGIKRCDSDYLPEARHWLHSGEDFRSLSRRRQSTVLRPQQRRRGVGTAGEQQGDEEEEDKEKNEEDRYDFMFTPQREKPQLVQRATTLGSIYQQRNRLVLDPKTLSYANRDVDLISRDAQSTTDETTSTPLGLDRAVTFHGTIGRTDTDSLPSRGSAGLPASSQYRDEASQSSARQDRRGPARLPKPPKTAPTVVAGGGRGGDGGGATGGTDFMKEILIRKCRRTRRRPIEDRLEEFYTRIDDALAQEEEEEIKATEKDVVKRKWALLTKGVKAALLIGEDKGSDGDDT